MAEADWDHVTVIRKKAPTGAEARSASAINAAQRKGDAIDVTKKFTAATNHHSAPQPQVARKLENETEDFHSECRALLRELMQFQIIPCIALTHILLTCS
jgi:putative transcription factor